MRFCFTLIVFPTVMSARKKSFKIFQILAELRRRFEFLQFIDMLGFSSCKILSIIVHVSIVEEGFPDIFR